MNGMDYFKIICYVIAFLYICSAVSQVNSR
jgi:hypothetical protein